MRVPVEEDQSSTYVLFNCHTSIIPAQICLSTHRQTFFYKFNQREKRMWYQL